MSLDDSDLISRVLARDDRNAFSHLVRKYQSQIRLFLARMLKGNMELAEDLAQETFIQAYKKLETYRGNAKFASWLYTIARNIFLQHIRRSKTEFLWEEDNSEAQEMVVDIKMDLNKAMSFLRPIECAALTMCYCQDLTHSEVAEILDLPLGTLKTHVNRGRLQLQKFMGVVNKEKEHE